MSRQIKLNTKRYIMVSVSKFFPGKEMVISVMFPDKFVKVSVSKQEIAELFFKKLRKK